MSFFLHGDSFRRSEEQFLSQFIRCNDYFIDVGANIGHLSLCLAINRGGNGITIEAHPRTFEILQKNIAINNVANKIHALNFAIGESDQCPTEISDSHSDDCNFITKGISTTQQGGEYRVHSSRQIVITERTLDSISRERWPLEIIRLIKIDVEGYELSVLKGAHEILDRTEFVYFEYWSKLSSKYAYSWADLWTLFSEKGFLIYECNLDENREIGQYKELRQASRSYTSQNNRNFLAVNLKYTSLSNLSASFDIKFVENIS